MPFEHFAAHIQHQRPVHQQRNTRCSRESPGLTMESSCQATSSLDSRSDVDQGNIPELQQSKESSACGVVNDAAGEHGQFMQSSQASKPHCAQSSRKTPVDDVAEASHSTSNWNGSNYSPATSQHAAHLHHDQQHCDASAEDGHEASASHVDASCQAETDTVTSIPEGSAASSKQRVQHQSEVFYLQQQNSNLMAQEFEQLRKDIQLDSPWAREVFGSSPEASNIWIGNDCSTTSFHKDHYENLFAVVAGEKQFTLMPPCDVYRLYMRDFPAAQFERSDTGALQAKLSQPLSQVRWTPIDPFCPASSEQHSNFSLYYGEELPEPFEVAVQPGDLLYLPSLWLHAVAQKPDSEHKVIGVNFWYDMKFDHKYAYYGLVESLSQPL